MTTLPTELQQFSDALLQARRERRPAVIPRRYVTEPAVLQLPDAYAIQDSVVAALGGHGGWKVGAGSPDEEPVCAPLPRAGIHTGAVTLQRASFGFATLEVEFAFHIACSLPARATPYSRAEVLAAIDSVHVAVEILDSRLAGWPTVAPLLQYADLCSHGALIVGPATRFPVDVDQRSCTARLDLDGVAKAERHAGNNAGDIQRMLHWLANHAAARGMPLTAGDIVTTGSCIPPFDAGTGEVLGVLQPDAPLALTGSVAFTLR